jgi:exopolysaccharide production protein ExoY
MSKNLLQTLPQYSNAVDIASFKKSKVYYFSKRIIDVVGALFGIIVFAPLFLLIFLWYQTGKNKGAALFKQIRIGQDNKKFYIYKFRSMIENADVILKENELLYEKYLKNNYKLDPNEDPRITKVGLFLRKTSLDELPQLFNVLKGDMSLVGPRPIVEDELKEYGHKENVFLSVKPGLTGYWQVSGRSDVGYPERVDLELFYVYNQSLLFDFQILIKTVYMVIARRGAY